MIINQYTFKKQKEMDSNNWLMLQYYSKLYSPSSTSVSNQSLNSNNTQLLTLLLNHKVLIDNLLENQNVLKNKVEKLIVNQNQIPYQLNHINTISENIKIQSHHIITSRPINKHKRSQYKLKSQKKINLIQIVSTCPDIGNNDHENQSKEKSSIQRLSKQSQNQFIKQQQKTAKGCQTKNVIKNYGKSILTFIRKNKSITEKISQELKFDLKQFYQELQRFRGKVNSISQLKVFWTENGNQFANIFRILSNLYLKKHSIKHTFNSRVKNYGLHIKYRRRLLQILKNPSQFTCLKCF